MQPKNGGPPLEFINLLGGPPLEFINMQPKNGGPPLEFINMQPKNGGPPLELINLLGGPPLELINQLGGSASTTHQPTWGSASRLKRGSSFEKNWTISELNCTSNKPKMLSAKKREPSLSFLGELRQCYNSFLFLSSNLVNWKIGQ
jgi:hypothetical protein